MTTPVPRERIDTLADVLIPGGEGMPSASRAGATGEALDRVLEIRDDLRPAFARAVAVTGPPGDALRALHAEDGPTFEAFVAVVSCAYAM